MWQVISKFFTKHEKTFPAWTKPWIRKMETKAELEEAISLIVDEFLANPPGHKVYFMVNGIVYYAVRSSKSAKSIRIQKYE